MDVVVSPLLSITSQIDPWVLPLTLGSVVWEQRRDVRSVGFIHLSRRSSHSRYFRQPGLGTPEVRFANIRNEKPED
jgi:hypothetical protein